MAALSSLRYVKYLPKFSIHHVQNLSSNCRVHLHLLDQRSWKRCAKEAHML